MDINRDLLSIAQQHLGLSFTLCKGLILDREKQTLDHLPLTDDYLDVANNNSSSSSSSSVCRSTVVIADAWDFIKYQVAQNEQHSHSQLPELYDILIFDVYDMLAAAWDGTPDSGASC